MRRTTTQTNISIIDIKIEYAFFVVYFKLRDSRIIFSVSTFSAERWNGAFGKGCVLGNTHLTFGNANNCEHALLCFARLYVEFRFVSVVALLTRQKGFAGN
jgi:hypothetical protein